MSMAMLKACVAHLRHSEGDCRKLSAAVGRWTESLPDGTGGWINPD
ncbi:hypothetical protein OK016_13120 [Vibrio chagasii]|nr:hypothetical protein [Vibrio chagasii]